MKILILEDDPTRILQFKSNLIGADVTYVDTAESAKKVLIQEQFDVLFLDHDLGGEQNTSSDPDGNNGYAVALFVKENPQHMPGTIIVHSLNPSGVQAIMTSLMNVNVETIRLPFAWKKVCYNNGQLVTK